MKIHTRIGRQLCALLTVCLALSLALPLEVLAEMGEERAEKSAERASTAKRVQALQTVEEDSWPREISIPEARVMLYQPQVESFEGDNLTGRAAVSVMPTGETEPVFGAVWISARVEVDREERMVFIEDLSVPRVRFPESTPQREAQLSGLLEREIPSWDLSLSLDRLLTSLEVAEKERVASEDLGTDPPEIIFRSTPTVLVNIDGPPQLSRAEGSSLMRVANTPFLIVYDSSSRIYYLYAGENAWYTASAIEGDWQFIREVPAAVFELAPDEDEMERPDPEKAADFGAIPEIIVVTEPAELLYTDGAPLYTPVAGLELMYISNTDSDVVIDLETQLYYVLLSGRWYRSAELEGPWEYVNPTELPMGFMLIPADSEISDLRAHVGGTVESQEAVLDAHVPQTAKVDRSEATFEAEYDGEPQFESIDGTSLEYVINSPHAILRSEGMYYACHEGIWFVSSLPTGPWQVATTRPAEVEDIPAECPIYNVKYVYVYESTPDVVYVGYTPGYTGTYVHHTTIVYGTGYYYPGWYGAYYYPRPATWGFRVRYSPWYGWSFGIGYSNGWFSFGIGFGRWGRWRGGWWGPAGYRGYRRGFHRGYYRGWNRGYNRGARAGYQAGQRNARRSNVYRAQNNPGVSPAGSGRASATTNPGNAARARNNMYSDSNGNVFRQNSDGSFSGAGTARAQGAQPTTEQARQRAQTEQPSTAQRPSTQTQSRLQQDSEARSRGTQRTNQFRSSRSSRGGSRRGGGRRGGGRRGG